MSAENRSIHEANPPGDVVVSGPDMETVMASAGSVVLSFLPLGDLLGSGSSGGGGSSLSLVSTRWREYIRESVLHRPSLSFSASSHLRNRLDVCALRWILSADATGGDEDASRAQCRELKVRFLDLGRCRRLRGEGVGDGDSAFAALSPRLRGVRCLSFAGSRGVDSSLFRPDSGGRSTPLSRLEMLDLSGCPRLDTEGVMDSLISLIGPFGSRLRFLDLSGCSTTIDDHALLTVAECCSLLEGLGLGGLRRVTQRGVGRVAHRCRKTLRNLSLRGCERVQLTPLVFPALAKLQKLRTDSMKVLAGDPSASVSLPPGFVGDAGRDTYWDPHRYCRAVLQTLQTVPLLTEEEFQRTIELHMFASERDAHDILLMLASENIDSGFQDFIMFSRLEVLDLDLSDGPYLNPGGCVAAIAWSSGGRLRDVSVVGCSNICDADIQMVGATSGSRMKTLSLDCCSKLSGSAMHGGLPNLTELSIKCCHNFSDMDISATLGREGHFVALRHLRMDFIHITDSTLSAISRNCPDLNQFSIAGCSKVTSEGIWLHFRGLGKLRELDARECLETLPWSKVLLGFPQILKFNGRRTVNGTALMERGMNAENWRLGNAAATIQRKRQRDGMVESTSTAGGTGESLISCCSLSWAGRDSNLAEQEMFHCWTCRIEMDRMICYNCVHSCHKARGHDVVPCGFRKGYCDCAVLGSCAIETTVLQ